MKKPQPAPPVPHPRIYISEHAASASQVRSFNAYPSAEQYLAGATNGEHIVAEYAFVGFKKALVSVVMEDVAEPEPAK